MQTFKELGFSAEIFYVSLLDALLTVLPRKVTDHLKKSIYVCRLTAECEWVIICPRSTAKSIYITEIQKANGYFCVYVWKTVSAILINVRRQCGVRIRYAHEFSF